MYALTRKRELLSLAHTFTCSHGGSRAVLGQPGLPEFREGSSTGPGGFAGHLGVPASAAQGFPITCGFDS